jgi:hypothetical protein
MKTEHCKCSLSNYERTNHSGGGSGDAKCVTLTLGNPQGGSTKSHNLPAQHFCSLVLEAVGLFKVLSHSVPSTWKSPFSSSYS